MSQKHLMRIFLFASLLLLITIATADTSTPTLAQSSTFEPSDCAFYVPVGLPVECGYLVVPADRADPAAGMMRLHVSYFSSFRDAPEPDPVVVVLGGPGGGPGSSESSVIYLGADVDYAIFLEKRDLIVIDQRGTGYSEPSLNCRAYELALIANVQEDLDVNTHVENLETALMSCFDTFEADGINLTNFSTANTVQDLEDLRVALGITTWNLYGVGYGAQPALGYAAAFPDSTRSVILSSPITDPAGWVATAPQRVEASLQTLFEGCIASEECAADFPTLPVALDTATTLLNETPVEVQIAHPISGAPMTLVLNDLQLIETVKWSMLFADNILFMPFIIDTTALGSYQFLVILASQVPTIGQYLSEGAYYTLLCQEALPFAEPASAETSLNAQIAQQLSADFTLLQDICTTLELPAGEQFRVPSVDVPVLVLGGGYDHVSRPSDAEAVTAANPAAQTMIFPSLTYDVLFSWDTCPQLVTGDFLDAPSAPLATTCLNDPEEINFMSIADILELQGSYTAE